MLQLYINQLSAVERSKPCVRVTVAIIDSFLFDNDDPIKLEILRKHFIPLIGGGIRSTDDAVRNEFILAFDILVTSFSDAEPKLLGPFQQLQNVDKELDFFANLTHIQHHRRQRAFKRFANALDDKSVSFSYEKGN